MYLHKTSSVETNLSTLEQLYAEIEDIPFTEADCISSPDTRGVIRRLCSKDRRQGSNGIKLYLGFRGKYNLRHLYTQFWGCILYNQYLVQFS